MAFNNSSLEQLIPFQKQPCSDILLIYNALVLMNRKPTMKFSLSHNKFGSRQVPEVINSVAQKSSKTKFFPFFYSDIFRMLAVITS